MKLIAARHGGNHCLRLALKMGWEGFREEEFSQLVLVAMWNLNIQRQRTFACLMLVEEGLAGDIWLTAAGRWDLCWSRWALRSDSAERCSHSSYKRLYKLLEQLPSLKAGSQCRQASSGEGAVLQ